MTAGREEILYRIFQQHNAFFSIKWYSDVDGGMITMLKKKNSLPQGLNIIIDDMEIGYLAIHIERICS